MRTRILKNVICIASVSIVVVLIMLVNRPVAASAAPFQKQPAALFPTDPCEPFVSSFMFPVPIFAPGTVTLLGVDPAPNLVITCLRLDQTHYQEGENWQISMLVQNEGNASNDTMQVFYDLCRRAENGIQILCYSHSFSAATIFAIEPRESQLVQFSGSFSSLPTDPNPSYDSWIAGIPNNLEIWLKVDLAQYGSELGVSAVAEAVYPSAPFDLLCVIDPNDPNCVDEDGDGWSASPLGGDCNDMDPDIHPNANDIYGSGGDEDCSAGGIGPPQTLGCEPPPEIGTPIYTYDTQYPSCDGAPGTYRAPYTDRDQDGSVLPAPGYSLPGAFAAAGEDCDDLNSAVYPGAPELWDGLDNDCNGLIDEHWATPDWDISSYELTRDYEPYNWFWSIPGIRYEIEVDNLGDDVGADFSQVPVYQFVPFSSPLDVVASGQSGFIPYTALANGQVFGCDVTGLVAAVVEGAYGETNTANNIELGGLPFIGPPDLSLHFTAAPRVEVQQYASGSYYLRLIDNKTTSGSCPPLPVNPAGVPSFPVDRRVIVNDTVVYDQLGLSTSGVVSEIYIGDELEDGDVVCIEIDLDPLYLVREDHSDNFYVAVYEWRAPWIGTDRFEVLTALIFGAGTSVIYPPGYCNPPDSTGQALTAGDEGGISGQAELADEAPSGVGIALETPTPLPFQTADCSTSTPVSLLNLASTPQRVGEPPPPCEPLAESELPSGPPTVDEPGPDFCLIGPECEIGGMMGGGLVGLILFGLGGGIGGRALAQGLNLGRGIGTVLVAGVAVGGAVMGFLGGSAAQLFAREALAPIKQISMVAPANAFGLPSCDVYLDPETASPTSGQAFHPGTAELPLTVQIQPAALGSLPIPDNFLVVIASPSGETLALSAIADESALSINLSFALYKLGSSFLSEMGHYEWHVALGESATGGESIASQTVCRGSTPHTFAIGESVAETGEESATEAILIALNPIQEGGAELGGCDPDDPGCHAWARLEFVGGQAFIAFEVGVRQDYPGGANARLQTDLVLSRSDATSFSLSQEDALSAFDPKIDTVQYGGQEFMAHALMLEMPEGVFGTFSVDGDVKLIGESSQELGQARVMAEEMDAGAPPPPTPTSTQFIPTPPFTPFIPTPTFTPVPPQDTSPPKVSGANASPNPALTTSPVTISATVSDPSGVASVMLYYHSGEGKYTLAGPMKTGGGDNYSLNIGTLTPAGSYDFRILATDSLGNATCDAKNLPNCPGGTFQVNIP